MAQRISVVKIESVVPLTPDEIKALLDQLQLKAEHVSLTQEVNPRLLSGLRLTLDGTMIDMSAQAKLEKLAESLLHA
jgi:F0F1-type ATP synthase delta subunit